MKTDPPRSPAKIALEDGTVLTGESVGSPGETAGELCFNTSMTGYQEILTDPSYFGQLIIMTYPHIGNYGTHVDDMEAPHPMAAGLVTREFCHQYSNQAAGGSLNDWMVGFEFVGISGVDTRYLVKHIRTHGVMNAVVSSLDLDDEHLVAKARAHPSMAGLELASRVTTPEPYIYSEAAGPRIAVYDYGVKQNILRSFKGLDCSVQVFPASTRLEDVLAWQPDGVFLSNGPGDPRVMPDSVQMVRELIETGIPLFGICLGHQLLALAQDLEVYKMRVGHRGANQPVRHADTGRVEITTQNHGFAVKWEDACADKAWPTHVNLNDGTLEGLRFKNFSGLSVQYHPEASPGPHDSRYLFDAFLQAVHERGRETTPAPVDRSNQE
ncbi:MAG: glutamine-hydrolyzing carbamoyl-phosphate synthase small subunit [Rhodothermales bacterium]